MSVTIEFKRVPKADLEIAQIKAREELWDSEGEVLGKVSMLFEYGDTDIEEMYVDECSGEFIITWTKTVGKGFVSGEIRVPFSVWVKEMLRHDWAGNVEEFLAQNKASHHLKWMMDELTEKIRDLEAKRERRLKRAQKS